MVKERKTAEERKWEHEKESGYNMAKETFEDYLKNSVPRGGDYPHQLFPSVVAEMVHDNQPMTLQRLVAFESAFKDLKEIDGSSGYLDGVYRFSMEKIREHLKSHPKQLMEMIEEYCRLSKPNNAM